MQIFSTTKFDGIIRNFIQHFIEYVTDAPMMAKFCNMDMKVIKAHILTYILDIQQYTQSPSIKQEFQYNSILNAEYISYTYVNYTSIS